MNRPRWTHVLAFLAGLGAGLLLGAKCPPVPVPGGKPTQAAPASTEPVAPAAEKSKGSP